MSVPARYFGCVFVPLVLFILTDYLFFHTGFSNPHLPDLTLNIVTKSTYAETGSRYKFMAMTVLFVSIALLIVFAFLSELFARHPEANGGFYYDTVTIRNALLAFAAAVGIAIIYYLSTREVRLHHFLGQNLFAEALNVCLSPGKDDDVCLFGSKDEASGGTSGVNVMQGLGAGSAILAVGAASLGAALSLGQSRQALCSPNRNHVFRLPRLFLYLTSVLFTIGMLAILALMEFPKSVLAKDALSSYGHAVSGLSVYFGVSYSLAIAGFYGPVVLLLNGRIARVTSETQSLSEPGESAFAAMQRQVEMVAAILAPLATTLLTFVGEQ
ncbi:hypothetical protein [Pseudodonghicola xiamenensis]|uniref:Uncharacterized protein n=1 Tax=Pseudodonghicola xiamenensis TaxID=337702 RepID=A0A8J3H3B0_9RHOB|nr:hypothetical protein [Pseudodonghicola xiamenensis]GHG82230.1 hypothetical protein GCM10010961_06580 [Pseudodonghicola xiamenensis]